MENQKGKIQLITIIGILFIIILVLLGAIIYLKSADDSNDVKEVGNIMNPIVEQPEVQNTIDSEQNMIESGQESGKVNLNEFDLNFAKIENNKKNMIYSPLSIKYALKMLEEGANGNTYTQIHKLIGNYNLPAYKNIDKILSLANSFFIRDRYFPAVSEGYKNVLVEKYNAEIIQDSFANANMPNQWIEKKTFGIIKNMLRDEQVISAQMLLINALAIDMEWETGFDFNDTHGDIFKKSDGTEMNATMMNKKTSDENILYFDDDKTTALKMDLKQYEGSQLEFFAIMPKDNLQQYLNNLTTEEINKIYNNLKPASSSEKGIIINIPKFKFDYGLSLKEDLNKLGVIDAFNVSADFSKMLNQGLFDERLYVGEALHKADIDFSEEGIKAAAVTVFSMMESEMVKENQPIQIEINKPFVFLIRDKNTKENWFVGTVYEPNSWENDKMNYQK